MVLRSQTGQGIYLSEVSMICVGIGAYFSALGAQGIFWMTRVVGFDAETVPLVRVSGNLDLFNID